MLKIDGRSYDLPEEVSRPLIKQFGEIAIIEYQKLAEDWQFPIRMLSRLVLKALEDAARKKGATREQCLAFRPEKKTDVTVHLIMMLCNFYFEASKRVEIVIETDGDCISSLTGEVKHTSETGGQMVTHGNEWIREDDSTQVSGRMLRETVSNDAALRT